MGAPDKGAYGLADRNCVLHDVVVYGQIYIESLKGCIASNMVT